MGGGVLRLKRGVGEERRRVFRLDHLGRAREAGINVAVLASDAGLRCSQPGAQEHL